MIAVFIAIAIGQTSEPQSWEELKTRMHDALENQERYVDEWKLTGFTSPAMLFRRVIDHHRKRLDMLTPDVEKVGKEEYKPYFTQIVQPNLNRAVVWSAKVYADLPAGSSNESFEEPGMFKLGLSVTDFIINPGGPELHLRKIDTFSNGRVAQLFADNPATGNHLEVELRLLSREWLPSYCKIEIRPKEGDPVTAELASRTIFLDAKLPKNPFALDGKALKQFKKVSAEELVKALKLNRS